MQPTAGPPMACCAELALGRPPGIPSSAPLAGQNLIEAPDGCQLPICASMSEVRASRRSPHSPAFAGYSPDLAGERRRGVQELVKLEQRSQQHPPAIHAVARLCELIGRMADAATTGDEDHR